MSQADNKGSFRLIESWSIVFERPNFAPQWAQELHSALVACWREIADETDRSLDETQVTLLYLFARDAIDIGGAIADTYSEEDLLTSLVYVEWLGLFANELPTFYLLFLSGQYRHVMSQLRFNWERIFQASQADAKCLVDSDGTAESYLAALDTKHDWLSRRETNPNWPRVIVPTLKRVFRAKGGDMKLLESRYKPVWGRLNRCVHPSGELREILFGASNLQVNCAFDRTWALQTLEDAAEVFGLICLAVLSRFPKAISDLKSQLNTLKDRPHLCEALAAHQANAAR
jgi:hypothetical protein